MGQWLKRVRWPSLTQLTSKRLTLRLLNQLTNAYMGLGLIVFVLALRAIGTFEVVELLTLDRLLRVLKSEPRDSSIAIVSIDADYLKDKNPNSIQYRDLAKLLEKILDHQPAVVGIDIVDRRLAGDDTSPVSQLFEQNPNLLTVETTAPRIESSPIQGLDARQREQQVGFNDLAWDRDKNVRRAILGYSPTGQQRDFRFSFSLKVAQHFLENTTALELDNGIRDPDAMRFGQTEIPRLTPHFGGYNQQSVYGIQTLINFRRGAQPFEVITASDLLQGQFDPTLIEQKIVLVGITHPSSANYFFTTVPQGYFYEGYLLGIEVHAHIVSQIISAVIEKRPLLWAVGFVGESVWIIFVGLVGIWVGRLSRHTTINLTSLVGVTIILWSLSYLSLKFLGLWMPIVPSCLVLIINGIVYTAFYQNDRKWKLLIAERDQALLNSEAIIQERDTAIAAVAGARKKTIEHAFDTIHNGPLQTLADLLRRARDNKVSNPQVCAALAELNQEIRDLGETLKQEAIREEDRLYLNSEANLDLNIPLHELFYEVYIATLERDFPGFAGLQVQVRSFDAIENETLTIASKRKLCIFLQEALCNVGKHALGSTRLTVTGELMENAYQLTIVDNGIGYDPASSIRGEGTQIGLDAEAQLGGKFTRLPCDSKGTFCQFVFPLIPN